MKDIIYVTGHRNPDTDSIVAAIAHAEFLKRQGYLAVAGRLGSVSSETEFLLERFGFSDPIHIFSAKANVGDIDFEVPSLAKGETTIKEAIEKVLTVSNKSVFVVDKNKHLEGVVSISDLTSFWTIDEQTTTRLMSSVLLDNIIKTLDANSIHLAKEFKTNGKIHFFPNINGSIDGIKGGICIVSNEPSIQRACIDQKVALIIIVGEDWVDNLTLDLAIKNNINIIHTNLNPLSVSKLIYQAISIKYIMNTNSTCFHTNESVDDAINRITKTRFRAYPVLDEENRVVGSISRYHLFNAPKRKFVLVDHNEAKQSVPDIDDAEIIEVIDHHRIGGFMTLAPIKFQTMVVGATCTIIAKNFFDHNYELSKELAGLLLGGIIADTLNFKSPTTTKLDEEIANKLALISGEDSEELAKGLIEARPSILAKRFIELVYEDFKEFKIEGLKVGIGQTQCKSSTEFFTIEDKFGSYLEDIATMNKYDIIMVLFTKPSGSGSYYLIAGPKKNIVISEFKALESEKQFLKSYISRKKQIVPAISEFIREHK